WFVGSHRQVGATPSCGGSSARRQRCGDTEYRRAWLRAVAQCRGAKKRPEREGRCPGSKGEGRKQAEGRGERAGKGRRESRAGTSRRTGPSRRTGVPDAQPPVRVGDDRGPTGSHQPGPPTGAGPAESASAWTEPARRPWLRVALSLAPLS